MNAGHRPRRRRVDRADAGVGVWAAHEAGMDEAGKLYVVDKARPPGEQERILHPRDAGAELLRPHDHAPARSAFMRCSPPCIRPAALSGTSVNRPTALAIIKGVNPVFGITSFGFAPVVSRMRAERRGDDDHKIA